MSFEANSPATQNCAIYARRRNVREASLESQVQVCQNFAKEHGWAVADDHIFCDKGRKSHLRSLEHPGLKALLELARAEDHPIDAVLVDVGCRFGRKLSDMAGAVRAFSDSDVDVTAVIGLPPVPVSVAITGPEADWRSIAKLIRNAR